VSKTHNELTVCEVKGEKRTRQKSNPILDSLQRGTYGCRKAKEEDQNACAKTVVLLGDRRSCALGRMCII
jgi:hypothetical protein